MITSVLIIPGCGWSDTAGLWTPGFATGRLREVDLVDTVVGPLVDELDAGRIRAKVLDTRKHPGLTPEGRFLAIEANMMVVSIGMAMHVHTGKRPRGVTFYGTSASLPLAALCVEALGLWGKTHDRDYIARKPRRQVEPTLTVPDTIAVHIEPLDMAAAGADMLAARLPACGRSVGWAIQEYLRGREHSASRGPLYKGLGITG